MLTPLTYALYGKKFRRAILNPSSMGNFSKEYAKAVNLELISCSLGQKKLAHLIEADFLVDPTDGIVVDIRYRIFGSAALLGFMEGVCRIAVGKNYDQVRRISEELIRKEFEDPKEKHPPYPKETYPLLNHVLDLLDAFALAASHIPLSQEYTAPPAPLNSLSKGEIAGWESLPLKEQMRLIEEVLDQEVRPYIALDAGGVNLLDVRQGEEVVISYEGACTSCHSSTGATLAYIQQILKDRIHPSLFVTPIE